MKKTLAMLLALCLLLGMTPALADDAISALSGAYVLDASPLGMPLQVYLFIDESGNFQWSNKAEGGADKGSGMIGGENGVYMMLYSDSTAEAMKTATFTVEGQSLVFTTRIPYGSSGFAPQTEDSANPVYPTAKKLVSEEALGLYVGSHEAEIAAMGAKLTYAYELTLAQGAEFTFVSRYTVMGQPQEFVQQGSFELKDGQLTLTSDGAAQTGTLKDGVIAIDMLVSAQGSTPAAIELQKATTAEAAGIYTGVKDMSAMGFVANAALTLDAVGGYTYLSQIEGEPDYTDSGKFTLADGKITLQSDAEGAAAVEGTLGNDVLEVKMKISAAVPMATQMAFYSDRIQGVFTAAGTDAAGTALASTLTLLPNGTYSIAVTGAAAYQEEGTFAVAASPMGTSLILTSAAGVESTGVVSATINITHNIDSAFNTLGFEYAK